MPKMKTHSGIKKRVKVTGSGKLVRQKAGMRLNLEKKPSTIRAGWPARPRCRPPTPRGSRSCSAGSHDRLIPPTTHN